MQKQHIAIINKFLLLATKAGAIINEQVLKTSPITNENLKSVLGYHTALEALITTGAHLQCQYKLNKKGFGSGIRSVYKQTWSTSSAGLLKHLKNLAEIFKQKIGSKSISSLLDVYHVLHKQSQLVAGLLDKTGASEKGSADPSDISVEKSDLLDRVVDYVQGGDLDKNSVETPEIKVGGFDNQEPTVYISGAHAQQFITRAYTILQLLKQDLENSKIPSFMDKEQYYNTIFLSRLAEIFSLPPTEANMVEFVKTHIPVSPAYLVEHTDCYQILRLQYNKIVSEQLPKLRKYYQDRVCLVSNDGLLYKPDFDSAPGVVETGSPLEQIAKLVQLTKITWQALHQIDARLAVKTIEKAFDQVNNLETEADAQQMYDQIHTDLDRLVDSKFGTMERHNTRVKIMRELDTITSQLTKEIPPIPPVVQSATIFNMPQQQFPTGIREKMEYLLTRVDYILLVTKSFLPYLRTYETWCDGLTNLLGDIYRLTEMILNPDNKLTCVKKGILVVTTMLSSELLQNLIRQRFPRLNHLSANLDSIISRLGAIFSLDYRPFYQDKKLQVERLQQTIDTVI